MISLAKRARYTLVRGVMGDVQGRASPPNVLEYQDITSPRMGVRHLNIAGVAWSNLKPGININRQIAIVNIVPSVEVANVGTGIHIAVVELKGRGGRDRHETLRAWGAVFGGAAVGMAGAGCSV